MFSLPNLESNKFQIEAERASELPIEEDSEARFFDRFRTGGNPRWFTFVTKAAQLR